MKNRRIGLTIIIVFLISIISQSFCEASNQKTIIIVLDELDFEIAKKIMNENISLGLMSIKTGELYGISSKESIFLTIAAGRRLKIREGLYKDIIETESGLIKIDGYNTILNEYKKKYPAFSSNISFLGDSLKDNGIKTGVIGKGPSSLIIANSEGTIDKGIENIRYNEQWLLENTNELFKTVDVLLVSYSINSEQYREEALKRYIESFSKLNNYQIFVFSENIKGDISYRLNTTIVPLLYKNNESDIGILTSKTTKREGIITSLDIKASIELNHGIEKEDNIGNKIDIVKKDEILEKSKYILLGILNLNIIKYIFHGYIILAQLYVIFDYIFGKGENLHRNKIIIASIPLLIFISLIYGLFNFHWSITTYCVFTIITSLIISKTLVDRGVNSISFVSTITSILILIGTFFTFDMIYNSFIGYNNIVAGGRFYGLNNDIMGVLIATAIIAFYQIKKTSSHYLHSFLALIFILIVIFSLSSSKGANIGGYITSIILFLILMYETLFKHNKNLKKLALIIFIGLLILATSLYLDSKYTDISHLGSLINRIRLNGFDELLYMLSVKIKQLLLMSILPPWSIIVLFQIIFLRQFYKSEKPHFKRMRESHIELFEKYCIMFIVSFIAFIINDTGAVAFTYINTYLIASLFDTRKV